MVEDTVSDGTRIAQLLSSELSGRQSGPLADASVVDADPDADPSSDGTFAYAVEFRDERVGEVRLLPTVARLDLSLSVDHETVAGYARDGDLAVVESAGAELTNAASDDAASDDAVTIRIESGAAVKRAVDVLVDALSDRTQ